MAKTKSPARKKKPAATGGAAKGNTQLEKYFHDALKDIYWAEKALTKALPKLKKASTTEALQSAIETHLGQTKEQITRLEEAFQLLGKKAQGKKCEAMEGLVKEGEEAVESTEKGSMTRDVAIIVACQKVEHYEIATYGSLVQLARTMGNSDVANVLETTLEEEKETDLLLTSIAENNINWEAEQEEEAEEEA